MLAAYTAEGPLHVVAAYDAQWYEAHVVTAYRPDAEHFEDDYASRCHDLRSVRRLTMSAIKVLSNEKIAKTRLARKREIRQARQKRAVEKDKRLAAMPKQTISIGDYQ